MARSTVPGTSLLFFNSFSGFHSESSNSAIQHLYSGISAANESDNDPEGFKDNVETIIRVWSKLAKKRLREEDLVQTFINCKHVTNLNELLKSDDFTNRFLRIAIRNSIKCIQEEVTSDSINSIHSPLSCDIVIKLISIMINNATDGNSTRKLKVLNEVLGLVAGYLNIDHEDRNIHFHRNSYQRIMLLLFTELSPTDLMLGDTKFQALMAFCNTLHIVRPEVAPAFSVSWLDLVADKILMDRVLENLPQHECGAMYWTLIIDAFNFLDLLLRQPQLNAEAIIFQETVRNFMTTLHTCYADFLVDCYHLICNKIPTNCIHIRNIILSASPSYVKTPNPFASDLNVNRLVEITVPPRALMDSGTFILDPELKSLLDSYLQTRAPGAFSTIIRHIKVVNVSGRPYDSQMMNDVVLYVGIKAIAHINNIGEAVNMTTIANSAHMDIFQYLIVNFDYEGRYMFLNAIANQLRYPNSHTHYFSCCLLYLFAEANSEVVQVQITRTLLERLIVNGPHPWGLQITVIELIKNPIYKFWSHVFMHCTPEIKNLAVRIASVCDAHGIGVIAGVSFGWRCAVHTGSSRQHY